MPKSPFTFDSSIHSCQYRAGVVLVLVLVVFTVRALCEPAGFLPDDIKRNDLVLG